MLMKPLYLTKEQQMQLEFEVLSSDTICYLSRLLERRANATGSGWLVTVNRLVNRSLQLAQKISRA